MLTAERLRELLNYDPETGEFTWRVNRGGPAKAGSRAGTVRVRGYRAVYVDNKPYAEHRLAWLYTYGRWPTNHIDHRNGVGGDNRLANLRECTREENHQNRALNRNSTSGYPGVCWHRQIGKWEAYINHNGTRRYLGVFTDLEEAAEAYRIAKAKLHTFNPETRIES